jgi:hypothetical protein
MYSLALNFQASHKCSMGVSCFEQSTANNYATFGAYSVCYNIKFINFQSFPHSFTIWESNIQYA